MNLYTKNGRPLQVSGNSLFSRSGTYLGRISNGRVYDPSGRYAGTICGDRVVYRSSDSATISSPDISANRAKSAATNGEHQIIKEAKQEREADDAQRALGCL